MAKQTFLRRLDQRVLPPIGRALSGFSRGTRRLRAVMVIASILSLAVVLLTVYVATRAPDRSGRGGGATAYVGVHAGTPLSQYEQQSADRLRQRLASAPGETTGALVSLRSYVTPRQLAAMVMPPTRILRVYTHVVVAGQPTPVRMFDSGDHLTDDMQEIARSLAQAAADLDAVRSRVTGDSDDKRTLRAQYTVRIATEQAEARAYASRDCVCVFALVVGSTPEALTTLSQADLVRTVDPAPAGVNLINMTFAPPRPEDLSVATKDAGVAPLASGHGDARAAADRTRAGRDARE